MIDYFRNEQDLLIFSIEIFIIAIGNSTLELNYIIWFSRQLSCVGIVYSSGEVMNVFLNWLTIFRNEQEKTSPSRPNFVALGVGLHSKNEMPVAWQLIPPDKVSIRTLFIHFPVYPINLITMNKIARKLPMSIAL